MTASREWGAGRSGIIVSVPAPSLEDAVDALRVVDPVLAGLVDHHGIPPPRRRVATSERFAHLAEIIIYQQLAGRAAAAIHGRFVDALDGEVTAERVVSATPEELAVLRPEPLEGRLDPRPRRQGPLG